MNYRYEPILAKDSKGFLWWYVWDNDNECFEPFLDRYFTKSECLSAINAWYEQYCQLYGGKL